MSDAASILKSKLGGREPTVAIVLGSGLGGLVEAVADPVTVDYGDLPGFPVPSVQGHGGKLIAGSLGGVDVIMLQGRAHYYEHGKADAMRPAIECLQAAGVTTLILTNAAGSLRRGMGPGELMLVGDHINFAGVNPLIGETSPKRFLNMADAYDRDLGVALHAAAREEEVDLHDGVYVWFSGPSFETPAEIRAAKMWGGDAVGMSTVPEVIIARFLGLRVAAISNITNMAAGMSDEVLSHAHTMEQAKAGGERLARVLKRMFQSSSA
jgi:purine-nucleoside phosphorylase